MDYDNLHFSNIEGFSENEKIILQSILRRGKIVIKTDEQLNIYKKFIQYAKKRSIKRNTYKEFFTFE